MRDEFIDYFIDEKFNKGTKKPTPFRNGDGNVYHAQNGSITYLGIFLCTMYAMGLFLITRYRLNSFLADNARMDKDAYKYVRISLKRKTCNSPGIEYVSSENEFSNGLINAFFDNFKNFSGQIFIDGETVGNRFCYIPRLDLLPELNTFHFISLLKGLSNISLDGFNGKDLDAEFKNLETLEKLIVILSVLKDGPYNVFIISELSNSQRKLNGGYVRKIMDLTNYIASRTPILLLSDIDFIQQEYSRSIYDWDGNYYQKVTIPGRR